tara:strand:- start:413 stop:841 length:429 start_codon:yes stop_codon:yes gene_type:complete
MSNQSITPVQWQSVIDAAEKHVQDQNLPDERFYVNFREKSFGGVEADGYRESILDNYDEFSVPSLHFDYDMITESGQIRVYDNSEQTSAPISLEQALDIASKMFIDEGSNLSRDIVNNYLDQQAQELFETVKDHAEFYGDSL